MILCRSSQRARAGRVCLWRLSITLCCTQCAYYARPLTGEDEGAKDILRAARHSLRAIVALLFSWNGTTPASVAGRREPRTIGWHYHRWEATARKFRPGWELLIGQGIEFFRVQQARTGRKMPYRRKVLRLQVAALETVSRVKPPNNHMQKVACQGYRARSMPAPSSAA